MGKLNVRNLAKIIVLAATVFIFTASLYCQEYVKVGNDSIEIINWKMHYHLGFYKEKFKLEDCSFNYYKNNNFKHLYDSLSSIYLPFKFKIKAVGDGSNIVFFFLVDSCVVYNLQIFIPDSIYKYVELNNERKLNKILPKLSRFGILAFKDSNVCSEIQSLYELLMNDGVSLQEVIDDHPIFKEYYQLLQKRKKQQLKK
ncbi:MAG: hypothetical protein WCT77_07455 [Bacteroidota bacterium]|jgi:hypothetical protein